MGEIPKDKPMKILAIWTHFKEKEVMRWPFSKNLLKPFSKRVLQLASLLIILTLWSPSFTLAQNSVQNNNNTGNSAPEEITASDLIDRLEAFGDQEDGIEQQLKEFPILARFETQVNHLSQSFADFQSNLNRKQKLSSWSSHKIDQFLVEFEKIYEEKERLKEIYLSALKQSEKLLSQLKAERNFFKTSYKKLHNAPIIQKQAPRVESVLAFLQAKSRELEQLRSSLTQLYQDYGGLFNQIETVYEELLAQKEALQEALFTQTHPQFWSRDFWRWKPLDQELREELPQSWRFLVQWNIKSLWQDFGSYVLILLVGLAAYFFFRYLKLHYKFQQPPFPLSVLSAIFCASFLLQFPPPFLVILAWAVLPWALFQVVQTYRLPWQASKFLLKLFIAYALIRIVETIDLPMVFNRLFLAGFAGAVGVYSLWRHRYVLKKDIDSVWKHWVAIPVGILFLIAMAAELLGFHLLAGLFINGIIKSAFLIFALLFFRRFIYQLLDFFFHLPVLENFRLLTQNRIAFLQQFSRLLHLAMVFLAALILPTIWQVYPSIRDAAEHILSWGITLAGQTITIGTLLEAFLYFYAVHLMAFFLVALLKDEVYPRKQIERGVANSISSLVKYSLWVLGVTLAFFTLGFELKQLAIIAGALSVGIGFGLQNIVNNFISGIILLFERPVKVGDLLEIGEEWGEVEKVGLRSTVIRTYSKTQLIIPNSEFITQRVNNLTLTDQEYRILIPVGIAYGSDTKKAQKVMLEIVGQHPLVKKQPTPLVLFDEFGDSSLNFKIYLWVTDVSKKFLVVSDILFGVDQAFRENGIEIPFPQRDLHLRSVSEGSFRELK